MKEWVQTHKEICLSPLLDCENRVDCCHSANKLALLTPIWTNKLLFKDKSLITMQSKKKKKKMLQAILNKNVYLCVLLLHPWLYPCGGDLETLRDPLGWW